MKNANFDIIWLLLFLFFLLFHLVFFFAVAHVYISFFFFFFFFFEVVQLHVVLYCILHLVDWSRLLLLHTWLVVTLLRVRLLSLSLCVGLRWLLSLKKWKNSEMTIVYRVNFHEAFHTVFILYQVWLTVINCLFRVGVNRNQFINVELVLGKLMMEYRQVARMFFFVVFSILWK